jgi:geranylgeranyl diphosphate synthase, type I
VRIAIECDEQREQRACRGQHLPRAVGLAFLLTGDHHQAEDLAQEAFVRLAGRFGHLRDPQAFGAGAAILLGDLLLGWSDELLTNAGLDHAALTRARPIFERMRTEVGAGQYLDILAQADTAVAAEVQAARAHQVIVHKSARYSVQHPLLLGGNLAAASKPVLAAYTAYGNALGQAFQLRDDVLGVFGDPELTGKPAGDDLREGKRTTLVAYALERADAAQVKIVTELLGDPHLDTAGIDRLRTVLVDTGARERVEERISELIDIAREALGDAGGELTKSGRAALATLIDLATARTR